MRLYISSGRHIGADVEERISTIKDEVPDIDVIFVEGVDERAEKPMLSWIVAPLVLGLASLWINFLRQVAPFLRGDQLIINEIKENQKVPEKPVDKSLLKIVGENKRIWFMANWLPISSLLFALYLTSPQNVIIAGGFFVSFAIVSVFLAFLGGINTGRDLHMAKEIAEYAQKKDVSEACLICGSDHHRGVSEMCSNFSHIEVVNDDSP